MRSDDIRAAVRALLDRELDHLVEAAAIYGSVAAGAHHAGSDVDCLVLLKAPVDVETETTVREAFVNLHHELGMVQDAAHPVEIFGVAECRDALDEPLLLRVMTTAAKGYDLDQATLDSDCVEVLRALVNQHLVVRGSLPLECLTVLAHQRLANAAARHQVSVTYIAERLGVRWLKIGVTTDSGPGFPATTTQE